MNYLYVTNALLKPYDEGFRKFAYHLNRYCQKRNYEVLDLNQGFIRSFPAFFLKQFDFMIYLPLSSITFHSFIRAALFKLVFRPKKVIIIGLQPREYGWIQKKLIGLLPIGVAVQSVESKTELIKLGIPSVLSLHSGIDSNVFKPVDDKNHIRQLREKYGIPVDKKIILHVGHLKRDRNVLKIVDMQRQLPGGQALMIASSSTQSEREIALELQSAGVIIINDYLPHIEELYQLADLYFFPVISKFDVIEMPLSVIEALACGIPVLSVKKIVNVDLPGFFLMETLEAAVEKAGEILSMNLCKQKIADGVKGYNWEEVFSVFFTGLQNYQTS